MQATAVIIICVLGCMVSGFVCFVWGAYEGAKKICQWMVDNGYIEVLRHYNRTH